MCRHRPREALARAFETAPDLERALKRYVDVRRTRAHHIQRLSAQQGLELLGEKNPSLVGPDPLGVYGYDVTALAI